MQLGVSAVHPCSYLPAEQERLVFTLPEHPLSAETYQWLTDHNFRRSGDQLYRPYCVHCQACQAVRLPCDDFTPNRSQRRLWRQAQQVGWRWQYNTTPSPSQYYPLYQRYIAERHFDGVMYPPEPEHLIQLLQCSWLQVSTLEQFIDDQLVAVTVLDELPQGFSAVYSFYQLDAPLALGNLAILASIELMTQLQRDYLYLGYFVQDSTKMLYKANFRPQQRLIDGIWQTFR